MANKSRPKSRSSKGSKKTSARSANTRVTSSRPRFGGGVWVRLPVFEQRDFDLIGLALTALGIFLAFVLYLGWAGGQVGEALADGLGRLLGVVRYAAPVGFVIAGVLVVMRPLMARGRPFGTGGALLLVSSTLALAAGTLGLGPDGARPHEWSHAFVNQRGGILGEALYTGATSAFSTTGAHVIALFCFLAGVLLVTGATIAGVVHALRAGAETTSERLRNTTAGLRRERLPGAPGLSPPELEGDVVVRARAAGAPLDPFADADEALGPETIAARAGAGDPDVPVPDAGESLGDDEAATQISPIEDQVDATSPDAAGTVARRGPAKTPSKEQLTPQGRYRGEVTDDPEFLWETPNPGLLRRGKPEAGKPDTAALEKTAAQLLEALGHFNIDAKVLNTVSGPHITRYELRLAPGVKMSKVAQLKDDLAYALAATEIRILAPIPGQRAVGIEVPNLRRKIVHLGDVFQAPPADSSPLFVWLGKDVAGDSIGADLARMPHLLVAGTTGSGKSGCVNAMLSSILLRATPHDVRFVLIDPKQVELNHYESIPHLLTPVITNPRKAATALQNLVREMELRYGMMNLARTRSLIELNKARAKRDEPPLPYILCVIDELADLMMVAGADVEEAIVRLAQKARAVGIHLVLATQSPRVDVITGLIKANVPSRIAFAVSSQTDSRVILDQNGAESLLGKGDMLFMPLGQNRLSRIQGAYVDEDEIAQLTMRWREQGEPEFHEELLEEIEDESTGDSEDRDFDPDEDPLLVEAIGLVAQMQTASTSMLQRRMRLGYTRAGRLIDMLERRGVISGYEGSKPRQVLVTEADVPRVLAAMRARDGGGAVPEPDDLPDPLDNGDTVEGPVAETEEREPVTTEFDAG
jgi:S-DNA-T family DNA segregation ATPase FtsK/SpoIIIE